MSGRNLAFVAMLAVLALALPATAITNGVPDDGEHPYVGTLLFRQPTAGSEDGTTGLFSCTGTMLSDTLLLTAGHCVGTYESGNLEANVFTWVTLQEEVDLVAVIDKNGDGVLDDADDWDGDDDYDKFDTNAALDADPNWISGIAVPHPQYDDYRSFPATYDVGLVILEEPVDTGGSYGELPEVGVLDDLMTGKAAERRFTVVGYGIQGLVPVPFAMDVYTRYQGETTLMQSTRSVWTSGYSVKFSNNPGKGNGQGGACFGDSGGPAFIGDSKVVAAVTSFGITPYCTGNDFSWRMDRRDSLDFVSGYLED